MMSLWYLRWCFPETCSWTSNHLGICLRFFSIRSWYATDKIHHQCKGRQPLGAIAVVWTILKLSHKWAEIMSPIRFKIIIKQVSMKASFQCPASHRRIHTTHSCWQHFQMVDRYSRIVVWNISCLHSGTHTQQWRSVIRNLRASRMPRSGSLWPWNLVWTGGLNKSSQS